jgi:acyl-ACP thioesterase
VRLADADPSGRLRLDALARFLQDIGNDDTADAGHDASAPWVTRRTTITVDTWPQIGERLEVTTWCGGMGSHYAERRTTLRAPSGTVEAAATWVHVDETTGRPARLPQWFHDTYAASAEGRKITARLNHDAPPPDAASQPWPIRWADLDVVGHVNNAAYWEAVEEALAARRELRAPLRAEVEHRTAIERGAEVELVVADEPDGLAAWLLADGEVAASARVQRL